MKPTFFGRYAIVVVACVVFFTPIMLRGTRMALRSNSNDVKSWLPPAYEETATFEWYWDRFPNDTFIVASWEGCTLDDPRLELLKRRLQPGGSPESSGKTAFFSTAMTGGDVVRRLVEQQGLDEQEAVERLRGSMIGADGRQTCLVLTISRTAMDRWEAERRSRGNEGEKFLNAAIEQIYSAAEGQCALARDDIHLGGPPVDNVSIDVEGQRSLLRLAAASAVVGLFMSWWCLRSVGLTIMVFLTGLFSAGLSMAAVWLSGTQMNAILLTMPSLVYVAATSGAIHMANYYRDAVRRRGFEGAAGRAVAGAWLPLALATGTTAIGLASLCISELVPIKLFGVFSAFGVVLAFFLVILFLPAMLELWPLRSLMKRHGPAEGQSPLPPFWQKTAELVIRRNGWVTAACVALMVLGAYGVTQVRTSVRLMRLFSPDARIIRDYAWLEEKLGPLVPMEVVLRVDQRKCPLDALDQMKLVSAVQRALGEMPGVGSTLAATTFVRRLPESAGPLQRATCDVLLERNRRQLRDYLLDDNGERLWRISVRVGALSDTDYGQFIKEIQRTVDPILDRYGSAGIEGVSATYTGIVPLVYKAQHSMFDGLIYGFVGDLILIGVAMVLLTRDWSAGLLLMVPSLFPLAVIFGAMGLMGIVVDTGTVMTPAVAFGVTVDDAIHFMLWVRHGRERGMDRRRAILFAHEDCARAIYQSWGVIGLGLFAFALSSFVPTQRFGLLMLVMLTVSSFGNLALLPALLAGPAGWFFWQRGWAPAEASVPTADGCAQTVGQGRDALSAPHSRHGTPAGGDPVITGRETTRTAGRDREGAARPASGNPL